MKIITTPIVKHPVSHFLSGEVFKLDSDYYMVVCPLRESDNGIPVVNLETGLMELMNDSTMVEPLPDAALQL